MKARFDGQTVTLEMTPDHVVSILDAIGATGVLLDQYDIPGLDKNIPNLEALETILLDAVSPTILATAQVARHSDHQHDDIDALFDIYLEGYESLEAALLGGGTGLLN